MKSVDLFGKFWIYPNGDTVDVTCGEHAQGARAAMLEISQDRMKAEVPLDTIFKPITESDARYYEELGVGEDEIKFLRTFEEPRRFVDPRIFAIQHYGWIRTRENHFYAWEWNDKTIKRLMACEEFWSKQPKVTKYSGVDLIEIKTGKETAHTYGALRERSDVIAAKVFA